LKIKTLLKPALMVAGLGIFGLLTGFLGGFIGSWLLEGDAGGWGGLVGAVAGMVFGYPIGVAIGMVLVKTVIKYPGSLLLGIPAALLGAVLVMLLAEPLNLNVTPGLILGSLFILVPLAGTIGYHLRR